MCLHKSAAAITCALEKFQGCRLIHSLVRTCIYLHTMISYLKEMMNVFFYKVKTKQKVKSSCATGGGGIPLLQRQLIIRCFYQMKRFTQHQDSQHIDTASLNWFSENTISIFFMNETLQTLMEILTEMITLVFNYQITPDNKLVKKK